MIPNPILKVLSTLTFHQVRYLLMGGQACVFYGAAEFSRDTDTAVLAETENLAHLTEALKDLHAETIAVPPFTLENLNHGHAVHFRCQHPQALGMRLDVMSVMRGVAPFHDLWQRRATLPTEPGPVIEIMALPDVVAAKKTQRAKDWPMIRRLVEANYARNREAPKPEQIDFWLRESRTISMLLDLAQTYPEQLDVVRLGRPLLALAAVRMEERLDKALEEEEKREREADRVYWLPLRKELETMRHERRRP